MTRPGLTPSLVVSAGLRLVERDGLEALSMRAVATELGTAATSLYRHVADRDALLVAMLEEIARDLPVKVPGSTPRERLQRRLVGAHDHIAEHVWVLHVLIHGEFVAEAAFDFTDACLSDFLTAGLSPSDASASYSACWHLTIGELLDSHPLHAPRRDSQRQRAIATFDTDRYPAMAKVRNRPAPDPAADGYSQSITTLLSALLP
jgi:AcrR family transcriptional regulator